MTPGGIQGAFLGGEPPRGSLRVTLVSVHYGCLISFDRFFGKRPPGIVKQRNFAATYSFFEPVPNLPLNLCVDY
jgi:hypothetical protein